MAVHHPVKVYRGCELLTSSLDEDEWSTLLTICLYFLKESSQYSL